MGRRVLPSGAQVLQRGGGLFHMWLLSVPIQQARHPGVLARAHLESPHSEKA